MASGYPNSIDTLSVVRVNESPQRDIHPADHNDHADAINKIEQELGLNPSGSATTVVERLDSLPDESFLVQLIGDEASARQTADTALEALIASDSPVGFVVHGADTTVARPAGHEVVFWYGSVEPTNGEVGDIWYALGSAPSGGGGGDLGAHIATSTDVHGITNASQLVYSTDARLLPVIESVPKTAGYTVATGDLGKTIDCTTTAPTAVEITVPAALGSNGSVFEICQLGTGPVDIVGSGVSFVSVDDNVTLDNQGAVCRARRISSTVWHLGGDLST